MSRLEHDEDYRKLTKTKNLIHKVYCRPSKWDQLYDISMDVTEVNLTASEGAFPTMVVTVANADLAEYGIALAQGKTTPRS